MKVGLQVYTVRNSLRADPFGTLEKVSKEGYKYIEFANHNAYSDIGTGFGVDIKELKPHLDSYGIKVVGAHIMPANAKETMDGFYKDVNHFKKIVEYYAQLGCPNLSIPIDFFPTKEYLLGRCEAYSALGKVCKESGITLLYHNHYIDFQLLDGECMMDLIVENTDPDCVGIELDAYWVFRGLIDPVEKIKLYGNRIKLLHEKDFPLSEVDHLNAWKVLDRDTPSTIDTYEPTVNPDHFIEVGEGIIKIQDVIDAGNAFNIPYILVEQDFTKLDEIDSIRKSMSNFKKMRGLEWD